MGFMDPQTFIHVDRLQLRPHKVQNKVRNKGPFVLVEVYSAHNTCNHVLHAMFTLF